MKVAQVVPDLSFEPSSMLPSINTIVMLKIRCCWGCGVFLSSLCIGRKDTRGTHIMVLLSVWDFMIKTKVGGFKKLN